jgi:hypothetical protein
MRINCWWILIQTKMGNGIISAPSFDPEDVKIIAKGFYLLIVLFEYITVPVSLGLFPVEC